MERDGAEPLPDAAALRVESIACVGFRGLDDVEISFHPRLTVLVGRNNAGKSRFLRALALAVAAVPAERDDLSINGSDSAYIDIVLAPQNDDGSEAFEARLGPLLARGERQVQAEDPLTERISWRTTISRSSEGFSATTNRQLRRWDVLGQQWNATNAEIGRDILRLVRGHLVETGRDLANELRQRGSAANRLIDDLELDPCVVEDLQEQLDSLSKSIVEGSGTFKGISAALRDLASSVETIGDPHIRPVPGRVSDLSTIASIELVDGSGQPLPLRLHGTGARSLTSLRLQGVLYDRRLGADGGDVRPHALTLIEEPEAHLHPQAQLALPRLLDSIPGQVIVSTHSTHLVSEIEPAQLRILTPSACGVRIATLEPVADPAPAGTPRQLRERLYASEMEKLRRAVERPFGELLFASAVVMGDGATERALLPVILRHALGSRADGLCVIDPGSMNDPAAGAVLKAAKLFGIPWFLFADGDLAGVSAVKALLGSCAELSQHAELERTRVVRLPADSATEKMFVEFDKDLCEAAILSVRPSGRGAASHLTALADVKGSVGRFLGQELIERFPDVEDWPEPLRQLVRLIDTALPSTLDDENGSEVIDGGPAER